MLYFAYGSNLDWAQMKQRCPLAKFVCRAKLPAHRLAFTLKSARRDCGVADVLPDQAKDVWGVVYELPDSELKNLDKREGYRPGKPYEQNQYTRGDQYVWPDGDAKQPSVVQNGRDVLEQDSLDRKVGHIADSSFQFVIHGGGSPQWLARVFLLDRATEGKPECDVRAD